MQIKSKSDAQRRADQIGHFQAGLDLIEQRKYPSRENIHVPLKHRKIFDAILSQDKVPGNEFRPPRYEVELAYGRCLSRGLSVQSLGDKLNSSHQGTIVIVSTAPLIFIKGERSEDSKNLHYYYLICGHLFANSYNCIRKFTSSCN